MAASNRQIKRDAAGQPIPQVFDEVADEYQAAKGTDGRQHAILYTADGEPVDLAALVADMAATKAAVVATQAALEAVRAALEGTLTTQLSGSTLAESTKSESDAVEGVVTFDAAVEWLEIVNEDESNTLTAVVNGITVVVPPGYALEPTRFGGTPSAVVTVSGSTKFTMNRYE